MSIKKIINKSLSIRVAEELERQITEGVWKIGEKIPCETELSELLGVSRNTLRESIKFLAISGVVNVKPGDGTYVSSDNVLSASLKKRLERESLAAIIETRLIIEPSMIEIATKISSDEELKTLQLLHQNLLTGFNNSWNTYVSADVEFHKFLADMTHNPILIDIHSAIAEHLPLYIKVNISDFIDSKLDLFLHKDLMNAILSRDAERAKNITIEMINLEQALLL